MDNATKDDILKLFLLKLGWVKDLNDGELRNDPIKIRKTACLLEDISRYAGILEDRYPGCFPWTEFRGFRLRIYVCGEPDINEIIAMKDEIPSCCERGAAFLISIGEV